MSASGYVLKSDAERDKKPAHYVRSRSFVDHIDQTHDNFAIQSQTESNRCDYFFSHQPLLNTLILGAPPDAVGFDRRSFPRSGRFNHAYALAKRVCWQCAEVLINKCGDYLLRKMCRNLPW